MKLTDLKDKKLTELKEIAKQMEIEKSSSMSKDELINSISAKNTTDNQETKNLLLTMIAKKVIKWKLEF